VFFHSSGERENNNRIHKTPKQNKITECTLARWSATIVMIFYPFSLGVMILNTAVDGDHRNGALSPDNIQVIGTASGNK